MSDRLTNKVLLLGWDAADWRMIRPMLERGEMPNLAALMQRGAWGNLATVRPILSPMLWTSIATGKRADKHGILGFLEPKPDASGVRSVASTSRKCQALWNLADRSGLRSVVVNWFASHPAEPIHGAVVSDAYTALVQPGFSEHADAPTPPDGAIHPEQFARPLSRLIVDPANLGPGALLPFVPDAAEIDQSADDRLIKLATLVARASTVQAASCLLLQETDWDLACLYFGAIDEFGHHFMPYHPPRIDGISERDAGLYGGVMNGCYRFHDMMLGRLLQIADEDTTVIIVSDHGFRLGDDRPGPRGYDNPEQWHSPFGINVMAGPGVRRGERIYGGSVLDVTPTILQLLGLPIGADMDGRAWSEVLTAGKPARRVLSWETLESPDAKDRAWHPSESASETSDPVAEAQAMRHLAELGYIDLDDHNDAQQRINQAIKLQRINLARALADSRRAHKAVDLWRELADEYPDERGYRLELARTLTATRRYDEALRELDVLDAQDARGPAQAIGDASGSGDAIGTALLRSRVLLESDRLVEAIAVLRPLSEAMPDSAMVLARLGQALLRRGDAGDFEQARDALLRANERDDCNPLVADALSELEAAVGRYDAAVGHALDAVSLAHHFPRAHFHLGDALARLGETDRAVLALKTSLAQAPGFLPARRRLGELLPEGTEADDHALVADSADALRQQTHPTPANPTHRPNPSNEPGQSPRTSLV